MKIVSRKEKKNRGKGDGYKDKKRQNETPEASKINCLLFMRRRYTGTCNYKMNVFNTWKKNLRSSF